MEGDGGQAESLGEVRATVEAEGPSRLKAGVCGRAARTGPSLGVEGCRGPWDSTGLLAPPCRRWLQSCPSWVLGHRQCGSCSPAPAPIQASVSSPSPVRPVSAEEFPGQSPACELGPCMLLPAS